MQEEEEERERQRSDYRRMVQEDPIEKEVRGQRVTSSRETGDSWSAVEVLKFRYEQRIARMAQLDDDFEDGNCCFIFDLFDILTIGFIRKKRLKIYTEVQKMSFSAKY